MIILGIESSCDETAIALVKNGRQVLASQIASQTDLHAVFGGVVPEVAAREHLRSISPIFQSALTEAGVTLADVDAIAVTQGPGLIGALLIGASFAKGLAAASGKPLIAVDHVHAHVHGALLGIEESSDAIFPALALVVSGGHTNLYFMKDPVSFELIACTQDDACGECFDKVAKLLGLPYPGGPHIERRASRGNLSRFAMPHVSQQKDRMAFSYSGLKTHVSYLLKNQQQSLTDSQLDDLCASFQEEALMQIVRKLEQASRLHANAKSIVVSGGVAANNRFRELVSERLCQRAYFPLLKYCSDNAAMIAAYAAALVQARPELLSSRDMTWDAYSRYSF